MLEALTRDSFTPLLNTVFQIEWGSHSIEVELTEVSELRVSRGHEAFSLVFRGPGDRYLPQATYRFNHSALGPIDLFIVPIGQDKHGLYYEAIFNRPREREQA